MWKGFQKPKHLASDLESLAEKYGRFSAQPFERGWRTTVGNALRGALLSSSEGAAVTAVKIEGGLHEFSSIPGVVEDARDIILNLKQVPIRFNSDLPIGYIPVDSVHSPVRKVNYSVEAARLGQMTDYEKLMMEVWTNGAITPKDAIGFAAKLVKDHMSIFINFEEPVEAVEAPQDT